MALAPRHAGAEERVAAAASSSFAPRDRMDCWHDDLVERMSYRGLRLADVPDGSLRLALCVRMWEGSELLRSYVDARRALPADRKNWEDWCVRGTLPFCQRWGNHNCLFLFLFLRKLRRKEAEMEAEKEARMLQSQRQELKIVEKTYRSETSASKMTH